MLHGSTVRSGISRGRLLGLHPPALPRGYRLIQATDIPGKNRIKSFGAQIPVFASESISYRGEALGLIVGPDPALADQFAASVRIEVEEDEPFLQWESFESSQIVARRTAVQGDPDAAFARAARMDRGSYRNRSVEHYYSEPMGAAAFWDYDKMAILCASQWPYHVRDSVAIALGSAPSDVVVHPAKLGMHLDGKLWYPSLLACQAAVAAQACGVPVKIFYTRKEDFHFSPKRARSQIGIRSALDESGRLIAIDIRVVINVGAYAPLAEEILSQAMLAATGIYSCPDARVEGYAVASNTVPMGTLGGLGASHAYFAIESHTNRIAQALGENPSDW
ncbi:MAG: xanthine dehydrogenase family protein, partial [Syntrophobacteraceae bacterium]|nr:xanthine dehydrogenase family protein [Syntrophobacteraceae bacterium]